jgi:ferredoxin-type protein NapG
MAEDKNVGRKEFFKEGPLSIIRAFMQGAQEPRVPYNSHLADLPLLRPPGAAPEADFLNICGGGGACANSCPAEAIRMIPLEGDSGGFAPQIHPSDAPCVVCDELACMRACPSGALTLVPRESIRMGVPKVDLDECFAWTGLDELCSYCVDRCPMGTGALRMEEKEEKRRPVVGDACVGCGVCEYQCPVYPAAIRIEERAPA